MWDVLLKFHLPLLRFAYTFRQPKLHQVSAPRKSEEVRIEGAIRSAGFSRHIRKQSSFRAMSVPHEVTVGVTYLLPKHHHQPRAGGQKFLFNVSHGVAALVIVRNANQQDGVSRLVLAKHAQSLMQRIK